MQCGWLWEVSLPRLWGLRAIRLDTGKHMGYQQAILSLPLPLGEGRGEGQ